MSRGTACLVCSVGVEHDLCAGFYLQGFLLILETWHQSEGYVGQYVQVGRLGLGCDEYWLVVTCIAEGELVGVYVQYTDKEGAERHLWIVVCQYLVDVFCYFLRNDGLGDSTAEEGYDLGHEEGCRHALAGYVSYAEDEFSVLPYVVVQVAACFACRTDEGFQVYVCDVQCGWLEYGLLDAGCHFQLALG